MTPAPRKPLFSSDYQLDILICLGLVLAIFIPYRQVATHRFVEFDDGIYAFQNTYIIRGLCWDSLCWAFTNTDAANWHPLTWISHLIDRELFGPHAGGYLLANVAWHTLASCLCYLAFVKTTGSRVFAFFVAMVFALHPANVENVAWASERKSLLNAVFWFAAIITYIDFIKTRTFRAYGVTTIAYLLSLLAKPMSVTLPCTLVLIHILYLVYHPVGPSTVLPLPLNPDTDQHGGVGSDRPALQSLGQRWKTLVVPVIPFIALSIYFCAVTMSAQALALGNVSHTLSLRLLNMAISYGRYLKMFVNPTGLAIFYPFHDDTLNLRAAILPIVILTTISVAALLLVRRKPQLLIGWCWYLGTMVPVIGLVQVGSQSYADRYLYIPMLGLAFVYPVLFEELRSSTRLVRQLITGTTLGVLGVSMVLVTQIQISYWQDGVALFRNCLAVAGDCAPGVINLAVAYHRAARYDELMAFADSEAAVAPPEYKGRLIAIKASALFYDQEYEASIVAAKQAIDSGDVEITPCWVLAVSNFQLGNLDEAARWYAKSKSFEMPVHKVSLVDVEHDATLTVFEKMLQEQMATARNQHPAMSVRSPALGRRIEAW